MTNASTDIAGNSPPDWDSHPADLLCPLCRYNLRYLTTARCPECGFTFRWQELLDAEKNRHKYIFEHGRGHNFKTFWKTYWRTCQPRRFWSDLNPAQPVRLFRLILYWLITAGLVFLAMSTPRVGLIWRMARLNIQMHAGAVQVPNRPGVLQVHGYAWNLTLWQLDARWPLPWQWSFWSNALSLSMRPLVEVGCGWALILILWPWLTLIAMLVFRVSMRKAKIRMVHLLRTAIYSCDFGLFLAVALFVMLEADPHLAMGWNLVLGALVCAIVTTYRLTIAFMQYLRVHLPLETVLASQIISLLLVFVLLVQIADFSRRV